MIPKQDDEKVGLAVTGRNRIASLCNNRDARQRQPTKCDVQLPFAGGSSAGGSSLAASSADGGHCAGSSVASVQSDVCGIRTSVDSAGKAAAGVAAAGSVHDSQ